MSEIFDTHQKYVDSIHRLSLSPHVLNIDRLRIEQTSTGTSTQSTREWANSIQCTNGKSLQCDTENGDKDCKAYLLVPFHHIKQVQTQLELYLSAIRQPSHGQNSGKPYQDRPREIDVPTASVQRNVDFIRLMSSADIWKNAPSVIRQDKAHRTQPGSYDPVNIVDLSHTLSHHQIQTQIRTRLGDTHSKH